MTEGSERGESPSASALESAIEREAESELVSVVERLRTAESRVREERLQTLRSAAETNPALVAPTLPAFEPLLTDESRTARLRAVKTVLAVAESRPTAVEPVVDELTDRLYDEFYFVRARAADVIGLVGRADPASIDLTAVRARYLDCLGDEEVEVREKTARAFARLAAGDASTCRYAVGNFVDHLDDDSPVVRFWLVTAVVTVAIDYPRTVRSVREDVADRLADENPFVRGRALEGIGVLHYHGRAGGESCDFESLLAGENAFVQRRACWALEQRGTFSEGCRDRLEELARSDDPARRERATEALKRSGRGPDGELRLVEDFRDPEQSLDADIEHPNSPENACPNCGTAIPPVGPPTCPECGAPGRQ